MQIALGASAWRFRAFQSDRSSPTTFAARQWNDDPYFLESSSIPMCLPFEAAVRRGTNGRIWLVRTKRGGLFRG
jgi:hypothetical protein